MRSDAPFTLTVVGVVVWLLLVGYLLFATEDHATLLLRQGAGTTASRNPAGVRDLYRALQSLDLPVGRVRDDAAVENDTTLVIIDPPPASDDWIPGELSERVRRDELTLLVAGDQEQLQRVCPFIANDIPRVEPAPPARVLERLAYDARTVAADASTRAFSVTPPGLVALVSSDDRPVVLLAEHGRGRVILVSDPRLFGNAWIGQEDNARLVLALCSGRSSVTFDDRWASHAVADQGAIEMMTLLYGTPGGRATVTLVLGLLLCLYLHGIGVGPRASLPTAGQRPVAYVDALTEALLAAGKGKEALRHFQQELRRRVAPRIGLEPDVDPRTLARAMAARSTEADEDEIYRLLTDRLPAQAIAARVRELDRLREGMGS
ncbi:MAG: hypothetical protein CMJ83_11735 [Planctomycetes bacterium]|nr:hypothetical protein [Planctomycetota bacterium]